MRKYYTKRLLTSNTSKRNAMDPSIDTAPFDPVSEACDSKSRTHLSSWRVMRHLARSLAGCSPTRPERLSATSWRGTVATVTFIPQLLTSAQCRNSKPPRPRPAYHIRSTMECTIFSNPARSRLSRSGGLPAGVTCHLNEQKKGAYSHSWGIIDLKNVLYGQARGTAREPKRNADRPRQTRAKHSRSATLAWRRTTHYLTSHRTSPLHAPPLTTHNSPKKTPKLSPRTTNPH